MCTMLHYDAASAHICGVVFTDKISMEGEHMTQRFISDYIRDRDQFQCDRFNLIQAPCGAGKSYFVSTSLLSIFPDVEPWEVVFVTSRAITVAQQVTHYPKLCNYDNETKK